MRATKRSFTSRVLLGALVPFAVVLSVLAARPYLHAQNKSEFPDGYDAVQAAPNSHHVIFENEFVRVLEVTVPAPGSTEPMHHHRWPSFFLDWDTGGPTPHVRYHHGDGTITDQPSINNVVHPGSWRIHWMKPEPLHAIEVISRPQANPSEPPLLRVELKFLP